MLVDRYWDRRAIWLISGVAVVIADYEQRASIQIKAAYMAIGANQAGGNSACQVEPLCSTSIGAREVGPRQHRSIEDRIGEIRFAEVRACQVGAGEVGIRKILSDEVRAAEVAARQLDPRQ